MKTILAMTYGLSAYFTAFVTLILFALFTLSIFLPFTVDGGGLPLGLNPWLMNTVLIALFGLQHSIMARPSFKQWLHRYIAMPFERATYLIFSSIPLLLLVIFWQPMDGIVWQFSSREFVWLGYGIAALGWLLVVLSTFSINHFDLFGLRQIYFYVNKKEYVEVEFGTPLLYRIVRHPMQLGVVLGIWFIPTMTFSHLFLSIGMTIYILVGLFFEERDLVRAFGKSYREYQARVPKLIPRIFRLSSSKKRRA